MNLVRPAAVAGYFYPGEPKALAATVRGLLETAPVGRAPQAQAPQAMSAGQAIDAPKAMIVPHAGYVYSGPIAATAYARLAPLRSQIKRVVLIGPAHRVALRGLAIPSCDAFDTPLGRVPVDKKAVAALRALPFVTVSDEAHAEEHSLEVHLPFLQAALDDFAIVPIVAGAASAEDVARVLETLWGGPETLIVISSDLSHYLDYQAARRIDAATTQAIERLRPSDIGHEQACGRIPIIGLLTLAQKRGMSCATVDLRNSGDTAGDKSRVVGYGSYLFFEPRTSSLLTSSPLRERFGETLLAVAEASVAHGLETGQPLPAAARKFPPELRDNGACFITLKIGRTLRGCVGSPQAFRPLIEDVADNAFCAAFGDSRFEPLTREEWARADLSISVLTPPVLISCLSEAQLLATICPGIDGLILADGFKRGLFLPAVWESLSDPAEFVRQLKRKAGLPPDHWTDTTQVFRFAAVSISHSGRRPPR